MQGILPYIMSALEDQHVFDGKETGSEGMHHLLQGASEEFGQVLGDIRGNVNMLEKRTQERRMPVEMAGYMDSKNVSLIFFFRSLSTFRIFCKLIGGKFF